MIDRFLVNEPGNDILEDEEQPILFMNYSVRGRRLPTFCKSKVLHMCQNVLNTTVKTFQNIGCSGGKGHNPLLVFRLQM